MELEEDDFAQILAEVVRESGRVTRRREALQRVVECVVKRVSSFKFPFYMEVYNAEMDVRGINDALRLEFFCQIATRRIYAKVKEIEEAHSSWETFEEALWRAYDEPPRSRN